MGPRFHGSGRRSQTPAPLAPLAAALSNAAHHAACVHATACASDTHARKRACKRTRARTRAHRRTNAYTHRRTNTHTLTHTCTRTHAHTHTHKHTHSDTHTPLHAHRSWPGPAEIQRRSTPVVVSGSDAVIQSETGSGKTAAFLVPALSRLAYPPDLFVDDMLGPQLLVLVPTFELGTQVRADGAAPGNGLAASRGAKATAVCGYRERQRSHGAPLHPPTHPPTHPARRPGRPAGVQDAGGQHQQPASRGPRQHFQLLWAARHQGAQRRVSARQQCGGNETAART